MVSVGDPRDDWNAIDPIRDVKYLVECIKKVEKRREEFPLPPHRDGLNPKLVARVLPNEIMEMINGRLSTRIPVLRNILRSYISTYGSDPASCYGNLAKIRRYMVMNVLYNGLKPREVDTGPVALTTAGLHEMLLIMIQRTLDGDFTKSSDYKTYPIGFLATEIISYFMHPLSTSFTTFVEMFFRDLRGVPELMLRVLDKQTWFESFAAVRLFGFGSQHPSGCLWLLQHPEVLTSLLCHTHQSEKIVEEWIEKEKMSTVHHYAKILWQTEIKTENSVRAIRIMGTYTSCMAVLIFGATAHQFYSNIKEFMILRNAVYDAAVLQNFHIIARQVTRWLTPCRFLSDLVRGIARCIDLDKLLQFLFIDDFAFFKSHQISANWESLKLFSDNTLHTSNFTFILHLALTNKTLIGAHWATFIIVSVLDRASEDLFNTVIETHGYELLDLAHLVDTKEPCEAVVQDVILEALLRYGGFSHKLFAKSDSFVGKVRSIEKMPEFCVEAALFCRRANLEEKMSLKEKQFRVQLADEKKEEGNELFKKSQFKAAIEQYTEALSICPLSARVKQAVYYSNRAECYLRLNDPQRTVHDCNRSLCLDYSMFIKTQWRRAKAYQKLNMDYPAWMDMYCVKDEWKKDKVDNFDDSERKLREKLCYVETVDNVDLERKAVDQF